MRGWWAVAAVATATIGALLLPWPWLLGLAAAAVVMLPRGRLGFLAFALATLAINGVLLAWLHPAPADAVVGTVGLSRVGLLDGLVAGLRIVSLLGANLAILQRHPPARWISDLHLPRAAEAFVAAILIAAQDIARDFHRLLEARRMDGAWPRGRLPQAREAASLVPALLVASHLGAQRRREALRLAGHDTGVRFAPIVAVTALAVAGRLALVAVPNVSLTFVVVFAGGVAFGGRVGFWAGLWSMLLTDLMLSGLFLPAFVNVPTTAALGALGGLWSRRTGGAAMAAAVGVLATLAWSVATDALSWALIAENRQSIERLQFGILAGLAFNAVPAAVNGALFAAVVGPVARAFREDVRQPA